MREYGFSLTRFLRYKDRIYDSIFIRENTSRYMLCSLLAIVSKASTARKIKFSIKDFFSKYNQIRRKLQIWSYLLKKSLMENSHFLCSALLILSIKYILCELNQLKLSSFVTTCICIIWNISHCSCRCTIFKNSKQL